MPLFINSNISSLNARRHLNGANRSLSRSFERLSSGLRINSAADDAAGLAISNRKGAQVRSLNTAVRNGNDGISLIQTSEGALSESSNILTRMRELAVQAANDTNTNSDRASLQSEVDQLIDELNRIGSQTEFNTISLLDGTYEDQTFHVGFKAGQTISVSIGDMRATALGAEAKTVLDDGRVDSVAIAAGDVVINGTTIRASVDGDDTNFEAVAGASAISKAAAINDSSGLTGVTAVVQENFVETNQISAATVTAGSLLINTVDVGPVTNVLANDAGGGLVAAINAIQGATGVTAEVDSTTGKITLTAEDGRDIQTIAAAGTAAAAWFGAGTTDTRAELQLESLDDFFLGGANVAARLEIDPDLIERDFTNTVSAIDLSTRAGANDALQVLDAGIDGIASQRADLGAVQNRLESTISNLQSVAENLAAARSRIRDADFAAETAELTRAQIIQQAGVAMLAQANTSPQAVLSLLG